MVVGMLSLIGCASTPLPPISLNSSYWEQHDQRLGIYVASAEKPQLYMEGDVRLLDYAIIKAVMSTVSSHFEGLDISDYEKLRDELNGRFSQEGRSVQLIAENLEIDALPAFTDPDDADTIYFAKSDYSEFKDKLGVDQLLIIIPRRVGLARPYHGFLPLGDPRAIFEVHGELVDLHTNRLLWNADIKQANFSSGAWDEPPTYPGLTNAFYAALEAARQQVLSDLHRKNEKQAKLDLN